MLYKLVAEFRNGDDPTEYVLPEHTGEYEARQAFKGLVAINPHSVVSNITLHVLESEDWKLLDGTCFTC